MPAKNPILSLHHRRLRQSGPYKVFSKIEEIKIPDIGDFDAVEVIEIAVSIGDSVQPEDTLITVESDKASMDVPSPFGGTVKAVKIKAGDRVSQNDLILTIVVKEESENVAPETAPKMVLFEANAPETEDSVSVGKPGSASYKTATSDSARRSPPAVMPVPLDWDSLHKSGRLQAGHWDHTTGIRGAAEPARSPSDRQTPRSHRTC